MTNYKTWLAQRELCEMAVAPDATPLELIAIWNRAEQYPYHAHTIQCYVIMNPNCPEYILEIAFQSDHEGTRAALASNESAGKYFEDLAMDTDSWVRRWLADNPCVPEYIIEHLTTDPVGYVRHFAKWNLVIRNEQIGS